MAENLTPGCIGIVEFHFDGCEIKYPRNVLTIVYKGGGIQNGARTGI